MSLESNHTDEFNKTIEIQDGRSLASESPDSQYNPLFLNVTDLNETNIEIYIIPSNNRHLDNKFNLTKLNLTWEAVSLEDNILSIQLSFESPVDISTKMTHDSLGLHIFTNSSQLFGLTKEIFLKKKIVPQMYDNVNSANMIKTAEAA